ncbi:MAG: hypothetical protein U9Q81_05500 [Pseudomonadota bacterium]|nr:hypothetical protein [Pseudomonadota bacterium]
MSANPSGDGSGLDLDSQFSYLDALPDTLFEAAVTTRHGRLPERVQGIMAWRRTLLEGRLPAPAGLPWPDASIAGRLLARLDVLELAALCRGEESLTDHILKDICRAVDSVDAWREQGIDGLFDDQLDQHRRERNSSSELEPRLDDTKPPSEALQDKEPDAGSTGEDQSQGGDSGSPQGEPGAIDQQNAVSFQPSAVSRRQGDSASAEDSAIQPGTPAENATQSPAHSPLPADSFPPDFLPDWRSLMNQWMIHECSLMSINC